MKDRLDSTGLLHFWEKIKEKIPTKTSDIENNSGFITSADIPTNVSDFTNDAGYLTSNFQLTFNTTTSIKSQIDAIVGEAGTYTFTIPYQAIDTPDDNVGFVGMIQKTSSNWISVIACPDGDSNKVYRMSKKNGTWSSWELLAFKSEIPTKIGDLTDDVSGVIPFIGTNPITSTTNDTVAKWVELGRGWAWYNQANCIYGQPSQYGFLLNICISNDIWQIFKVQSTGDIYWRSGNGSTIWDANSWNQLANIADIASNSAVTSVNGFTGAVNVISSVAPSDSSTASQCLTYAKNHPNVMFVWAKYAAATYTPVQTSDHWLYTLYTTYTLSADYTFFQAYNTSTGDTWTCKDNGTWVCHMEPERTNANLTASVAVANETWTTLTTITLPGPGLYFIKALASFPSNATGRRQIALTSSSGTSGVTRYYGDTRQAISGVATTCEFSGFTRVSASITYYLKAWQNSGSSMNVSQYSGVDAVRFDKRST